MYKTSEPTKDVFDSGRRGLRHYGVRRANEKTVLTVVAFNSGVSNAEIARISGLAPQTVSAILIDLERQGLISRGPVLRGRRGQPATPILLNEDGGMAIGVEIGWRHLDVVLLSMHARVLRHHHAEHDYPDARTIFDTIGALVEDFTADLTPTQKGRLLDLGLSMPCALAESLHLLGAPDEQISIWRNHDPVRTLEERTGLDVTMFNDGNAGCWAELIAIAPPRPANIIYLLVSHFIAAGIVVDGVLWEGQTGNAAELGSILIDLPGQPPQVAHRVASIWALRNQLDATGHCTADMPGKALEQAVPASEAEQWIGNAARALAQVIYNTTTVLEQPLVVVDTVLSRETTIQLSERVEVELKALPRRNMSHPRVVPGQLGGLAPAIGAAELPLFRRYF